MNESAETIVPSDYQHDDVQAVAEYHDVSRAAVLALVLGVASLLAVFSNALLFLPLVGTIISLLALRRIAASDGELAGRRLALIGLAVSVVVGAGIVTRDVVSKRIVASQALPWAEEWCRLVMAGKDLAALELTHPAEARRAIDESLDEYYQTNETAQQSLKDFRENEVVKLLTDAGEGHRVVPGEVLGMVRDSSGNFILLQAFRLVPSDDQAASPGREFRLQLRKSGPAAKIPGVWHVSDFVFPQ